MASSTLPLAVVTGAGRGIGRAIATRFANGGFRVLALGRSSGDGDPLSALRLELTQRGGEFTVVPFDASSVESTVAAAKQVLDLGTPKVLVNNAGIAVAAPLAKTSLEDYERTMDVNVRAPFLLCQALMPAMAKAGGGRVINIGSTAGVKGFRYTSAYCASKHALLGMTRALAIEFAGKNVCVNAVCPGWTDTDMVTRSAENISKATGRTQDEARDTLAKMNPMGRLVKPEEVAELCWFLASDAAAAVTGASYMIDAGEVA